MIPTPLPIDQDKKKEYVENPNACNFISNVLSNLEFTKLMSCESTKEIWDKLININEGDDKLKKVKLQTFRR